MESTYVILATAAFPIWNGSSLTLLQLGYRDAGLDDCYQKCGSYGPSNFTCVLTGSSRRSRKRRKVRSRACRA